MRIAVIGLYNSGSTAIAGTLHRLGVNMGAPYHGNFFESLEIKSKLCEWWDEPRMQKFTSKKQRVAYLRAWIKRQEAEGYEHVGVKHPLLCLSAYDLEAAWDKRVKYIWAHRSLNDSINGLEKRRWFSHPKPLQEYLWHSAMEFFAEHEHLQINFDEMTAKPSATIARLIDYLQLETDKAQVAAAVKGIRAKAEMKKPGG